MNILYSFYLCLSVALEITKNSVLAENSVQTFS